MLSEAPLNEALSEKIRELHIITREYFNELKIISMPLEHTGIPVSLKNLEIAFFEEYVPYRDMIYPLALQGGPYPYSQTEFLSHGVKALEAIAAFMGTVTETTREYTLKKLSEGRQRIILQAILLFGSIFLLTILFFIVNNRIIQPISVVTSTILTLADHKMDIEIPFLTKRNEIGEMARAVGVFKDTLILLDDNNLALNQVSRERETLIKELQTTIKEIKILRGIIPVCAICKNIRNDEGYYEEITAYLRDHSEADFSHTICPSCLKKHYPEEFEMMKSKQKKEK